MSHFTSMKTRFQNLIYLEKALSKLEIAHQKITTNNSNTNIQNVNIVIPQQTGYNIEFCWNGQEYELITDISYWKQPYPVEIFIDKIAQQYAGEVIIGESKKFGFQPIKYKQNIDQSTTLILERWCDE